MWCRDLQGLWKDFSSNYIGFVCRHLVAGNGLLTVGKHGVSRLLTTSSFHCL